MKASAITRPVLLPRRAWAAVLVILLVTAALIGSFRLNRELSLKPGPNQYNIGEWEITNFPQKWLFLLGEFIRGEPPIESQEAHLRRFFQLTREISARETQISDLEQRGEAVPAKEMALLEIRIDERDGIENQVEATLEARISAAAADLGLVRTFLDVVWPPVDFEFTDAPHTLVTSPRDRIDLLASDLLRAGLSLVELEAIEDETQTSEGVSALAFPIGGVGAYPAIIDYPLDYRGALRIAAHEWTHHYLFFRPLGVRYNANNDLRTINETVADLVGNELANAVLQRWPVPDSPTTSQPPVARGAPSLDFGAELRALRVDVDALLAAGEIEAAEALMETKRQELVDAGYAIRKLNQAYFAFTNLYAGESGSPSAVNPIGPKVDQLRRQSASLSQFVDRVGGVTSLADLDRLLAETAVR
ncbi:MAG TPA: hypothetical protein VFS30_17955 [Dehalococcoidia bacterium]|nr:hypothetical protein [Dehalococcoidia bacterium]